MRSLLLGFGLLSACAANGTVDLLSQGAVPDAGHTTADAAPFAPDATALPDAATIEAPDAATADGGIPTLSDDCAPGTWCWERPIPGGEPASGAALFSGDRAIYVTPSGVLTRFEGGRWRSRVLDLPCMVTDLWAIDIADVYLACKLQDRPHALVRVTEAGVELFPAPASAEYFGPLAGVSPSALWASGGRRLLHFDGARFEAVDGPGGDILIAAVHVSGPDDLLVLESWGSGSNYGRLHRYRSGVWSMEHDFSDLRVRVEGPLVVAEDGLWMRAYDTDRGFVAAAHFDGMNWSVVTVPDRGSGEIRQVGTRAWFVSGARAWTREGPRWVEVQGYPGRGVVVGRGADEAWVFGDAVASRGVGGWRRWSEGTLPTLGFWRNDEGGAALLSIDPAALWRASPSPGPAEWTQTPIFVGERIEGRATSRGGPGWIATPAGLRRVRDNVVDAPAPWADNQRYGQAMASSGESVAILTSENAVVRFIGDAWQAPVAAPVLDDLRGQPAAFLSAVHLTREGNLYAAGSIITGDKQVHLRAWRLDSLGWQEIARGRGEFGGFSQLAFAGDTDSELWVLVGDLFRARNGAMERLPDDARTLIDFVQERDGTRIGVDGVSVFTWDAVTGVRGPALALPRVANTILFSFVHRDAEGRTRVSSSSGQVLRYTP